MDKKRGGQPKHWSEIARIRAWHGAVKRLGGSHLINNALDSEFAWRDQEKRARGDSVESSLRPRMFEAIESKDRAPSGRNILFRGMRELTDAVEKNPIYLGTQDIFLANLWDLFNESVVSPRLTQERIESILHEFSLVRCDPDHIPGMPQLISKHGAISVYGRCLIAAGRKMGRFKYIELLWSIYIQLESSFSHGYRAFVESLIDEELQTLFDELFPSDPQNFYLDAVDALLAVRLDLRELRIGGYGNLEFEARWPIISEKMLQGIKE